MQWPWLSCCPSVGRISFAMAEPHVLHAQQQVSDSSLLVVALHMWHCTHAKPALLGHLASCCCHTQ